MYSYKNGIVRVRTLTRDYELNPLVAGEALLFGGVKPIGGIAPLSTVTSAGLLAR